MTLYISPGESDTRLKNSNLFIYHASNHLCSHPRSKPMSNNPSLNLDHHVPLIGSCSLVAHHVAQHILQSVGSIYNLEECHIAGCTLQYPPMVDITVTSKRESVQWIDNLEGFHSLRVYPAMWHPSRLYIEPTDCNRCWWTWSATSEQDPINETGPDCGYLTWAWIWDRNRGDWMHNRWTDLNSQVWYQTHQVKYLGSNSPGQLSMC
jgi:hypothetical protein